MRQPACSEPASGSIPSGSRLKQRLLPEPARPQDCALVSRSVPRVRPCCTACRYLGWKSLFPQDLLDQERMRKQARRCHKASTLRLTAATGAVGALAGPLQLPRLCAGCSCRQAAIQGQACLTCALLSFLPAVQRRPQHDELGGGWRSATVVLDRSAAAAARRSRTISSAAWSTLRRCGPHLAPGGRAARLDGLAGAATMQLLLLPPHCVQLVALPALPTCRHTCSRPAILPFPALYKLYPRTP
jgi:hypothetical protein